jgi:alpha-glucosidase
LTTSSSPDITKRPWWQTAVVYQIYPRSFCDSNGDGVGDLAGVISKLDYLEWLGVDALWLNPTYPSPNADWGYDVSDYCDVHPELGTLADLDRLVAESGARGIGIVLDLVPNHSSDRHPWFEDSACRDRYIWTPKPTPWRSVFGGPAWTRRGDEYYLHTFLPEQPELNWWSEGVRDAFDEIIGFWLRRGVAGFRIDVAHRLVKKRTRRRGPDPFPPVDVPATHALLQSWRSFVDSFEPARMLVGETNVSQVRELVRFYGSGRDELHLAFNFPFMRAPLRSTALRRVVEETEARLPPGAWPAWTASNHDVGRLASRWCKGDPELARCALLVLLLLRGTPFLYYGDELGLLDARVPKSRRRDHAGKPSRDLYRTPMPWSGAPGGGFAEPGVEPWLPFGPLDRNVADQRGEAGSILHLCRDAIALRRRKSDLLAAPYETVEAGPGVWAWRRGRLAVAVNLGRRRRRVPVEGRIVLATRRQREGEEGPLELGPAEGAVVDLEGPLGHPRD